MKFLVNFGQKFCEFLMKFLVNLWWNFQRIFDEMFCQFNKPNNSKWDNRDTL